MLTDEEIFEYQTKYLDLLSKLNVDMTEAVQYLNAVDYFNKPATTNAFNAFKGGLCKYAVDLCYALADLAEAYFPGKYTKEDYIKVALFRDIYRASLYEACTKNVKDDTTGQWTTVHAWKVADGEMRPTFGEIGFSSYMIAKNFMTFSDEQIEAICYSRDGKYAIDLPEIMRSWKLVALTAMADQVVSYLHD